MKEKATTTKRRSRKKTSSSTSNSQPPTQKGFCRLPEVVPRQLDVADRRRERLIIVNDRKWVNGTVLHYYFFAEPDDGSDGSWVGPSSQKNAVRRAFDEWASVGLGVEFLEVSDRVDAELRIGFDQSDGSWSYLGRDAVDVVPDPSERTMNFGWDLTTTYGYDTALHEIGHALGFPHAHQNPLSGITWDEDAVLEHFAGHPNYWDESVTRWNVIRKLSPHDISGSAWDPDSIMQYHFEPGLIRSPAQYSNGLYPTPGLSATDKDQAAQFYPLHSRQPQELRAFETHRLMVEPGGQVDLTIRPDKSREYSIQTIGEADTVIVLFEIIDGEPRYLKGNDDSGYDRNAEIVTRLVRGREYVLRTRVNFAKVRGDAAIVLF